MLYVKAERIKVRIERLIWLDEIVEKLAKKHGVIQDEVREVLGGEPNFRFVEKGHRPGENVYAAMGRTQSGRYLIIFFIFKKKRDALVLSARDMTHAERKRYEKT
jgi:uncharacterized DUF497 family protein